MTIKSCCLSGSLKSKLLTMSALINESMFRYLYNEMSAEERSDFISFLENDPASVEQFNALKEGMESLSCISYSPNENSVNKIMAYTAIDGFTVQ
jgi:hypothetical protein